MIGYETLILETRTQKLLDFIKRNGGKCSLNLLFRQFQDKEKLLAALQELRSQNKLKCTMGVESCRYVGWGKDGYKNEQTLFYQIINE